MLPVLSLVACAPHPAPSAPAPATPVATTAVKPGINDNFLDPSLEVGTWVERFQAESREVASHRAQVVAALALAPGDDVADVGAGTGLYTGAFAEAVGPEGAVYAVDLSPVFLEHLRALAAGAGWSSVRVVEATATSSQLEPGSIDLAFVCDTYHHFEQPGPTLASLFTALRPGGRLVVLDFERVEGVSTPWVLEHVRAGKDVVTAEIEAAGFTERTELEVGLTENYLLQFVRP
jgi:predicted methyltransferase